VEEALRRLVRIEMTRRHIDKLKYQLEPNAVELLEESRRVKAPPGGFPD
jgi:predicted transcriptional regulator with HTH domain